MKQKLTEAGLAESRKIREIREGNRGGGGCDFIVVALECEHYGECLIIPCFV